MLDRILVALMLSTLVMSPAMAIDDENVDVNGHSFHVMRPADDVEPIGDPKMTVRQAGADLWDGTKKVAFGTKDLAYGVGSTAYDLGLVGQGTLKTLNGVKEAALVVPSYFYSDTASGKHWTRAGENLTSAWKDIKTGIGNVPTTAKYFKDGAVGVGSGAKKIGETVYQGAKTALESETGQKVKGAVANAASYVGGKVKEGAGYVGGKIADGARWLGGKVSGFFGNLVGFNDISFDGVSL
jgi:hypothetical protein